MGLEFLSLSNVFKTYDDKSLAVNNVSLGIKKGEFISLLGPSGSGKTSTLMMIAGFEEPSGGQILLNGTDLTRLKPWQRNIGMVFQNYALFPHMTVARNIEFPLKMRQYDKAEISRRVDEALALVGLQTFAHRYPRELSGGQQQRVALARGLVFDPAILLLDEPLGALDKNLREQMQMEIKRIHRELGITMIYVTHDQTEAMSMSDRIAVFRDGGIEQCGEPLEIYNAPNSRFVGEFLGDSNFFKGRRVDDSPDAILLEGIGPTHVTHDAVRDLGSTSSVDVLIRPERIRLAETDAAPVNAAEVTVETLVHYGENVLVVGTVQGQPIRMRLSSKAPLFAKGDRVRVTWDPSDCHLIPAN